MFLTSLHKDVVTLACDFIRYPSITPHEAGCLTDLHALLEKEGFLSHLVVFEDTTNLYARFGQQAPHFCFAGHVDVVPPGPEHLWSFPPFSPTQHNDLLYGRGIADMKGAIACFLSAFMTWKKNDFQGSVSLLLTSDEEGDAINGIPKMIPWLKERGEKFDVFLIGEPTGQKTGEILQIGRRGSVTGHLRMMGKQGHIAYPHLACNPIPKLMHCLQDLMNISLDKGDESFQSSHLEITTIETGNPTTNIIPGAVEARFGIRFNPHQTSLGLCEKIEEVCHKHITEGANNSKIEYNLALKCHGNPFITKDPLWINCVHGALESVMKESPRHTTQGGTTDGRFLCELAPVLEVGLPETTIHQINECVPIQDLYTLSSIYLEILRRYFNK